MLGEGRIDDDRVLVFEARIGRGRLLESADQERGDDQQNAARRDLCPDQEFPAERHAMSLPGDVHGRHQTEEDRGQEAHGHSECEDAPVRRGVKPGRRLGQNQHRLHHGPACRKAAQRPEERQHQALREQLPDETARTRSNRDPQPDFALPGCAAGHQKTAQIGTRDRENQEHQDNDDAQHRVETLLEIGRPARSPGGRPHTLSVTARLARQALSLPDVRGMLKSKPRGKR